MRSIALLIIMTAFILSCKNSESTAKIDNSINYIDSVTTQVQNMVVEMKETKANQLSKLDFMDINGEGYSELTSISPEQKEAFKNRVELITSRYNAVISEAEHFENEMKERLKQAKSVKEQLSDGKSIEEISKEINESFWDKDKIENGIKHQTQGLTTKMDENGAMIDGIISKYKTITEK